MTPAHTERRTHSRTWIGHIRRLFTATSTRATRPTRLGVEGLEDRAVPAAVVQPYQGIAYILGTPAADAAVVRPEAGGGIAVDVSTPTEWRVTTRFGAGEVWGVVFVGGEGNDTFENRTGMPSAAVGEGGHDVLIGGAGRDDLRGGIGNDVVFAGGGDDQLRGDDGHDLIASGAGHDQIDGGFGNDQLRGDDGNDTLLGGAGYDRIDGLSGDDRLEGGDDADTLDGGWGQDVLLGGAASDVLVGGDGHDAIAGEAGNDVVFGGVGNDGLSGGDGHDLVAGDVGNDAISGDAGYDVLGGGAGDDRIEGGFGNDLLFGDAGTDQLSGQDGSDFLNWDAYDYYYGAIQDDSVSTWYWQGQLSAGQFQSVVNAQGVFPGAAQQQVLANLFVPSAAVPSTFNWPLGGLAGDTRALTAMALVPTVVSQSFRVLQQSGPDAAAGFLRYALSRDYLTDLMRSQGLGHIADLTATADVARAIYEDPLINRIIQADPTALFVVGPGFTPQMHKTVTDIINRMPGTNGVYIDYVNTAMLAGLPQLVPMMQTITNPGAAFVQQTGISPQTTYPQLAGAFLQTFSPLPQFANVTNPYQTIPLLSFFGGPVG